MSKEYGIEAMMAHYTCMMTLLGGAGRLVGAYNMIEQMTYKPNACVHMLLAGDELHTKIAQIMEKLHKFSMEMEKTGCGGAGQRTSTVWTQQEHGDYFVS